TPSQPSTSFPVLPSVDSIPTASSLSTSWVAAWGGEEEDRDANYNNGDDIVDGVLDGDQMETGAEVGVPSDSDSAAAVDATGATQTEMDPVEKVRGAKDAESTANNVNPEDDSALSLVTAATGKSLSVLGKSVGWAASAAADVVVPAVANALAGITDGQGQPGQEEQGSRPGSVPSSPSSDRPSIFDQVEPAGGLSSAQLDTIASEVTLTPPLTPTISSEEKLARLPSRTLAWAQNVTGMSLSALAKRSRRSWAAADPSPSTVDPQSTTATATAGTNRSRSLSPFPSPPPLPSVASPSPASRGQRPNLPPAAQAMRQRLAENPYFPVRSKWRPPGYRRAVSLLASRAQRRAASTAARQPTAGDGSDTQILADVAAEVASGRSRSIQEQPSSPTIVNGDGASLREGSNRDEALVGASESRRKFRVYMDAVPKVATVLVNAVGRRLVEKVLKGEDEEGEDNRSEGVYPAGGTDSSSQTGSPQHDGSLIESPAEVETDGVRRADDVTEAGWPGGRRNASSTPWWRVGAVAAVSVGLGLAHPIVNRLPGVLAAGDDGVAESTAGETTARRDSDPSSVGRTPESDAVQQQQQQQQDQQQQQVTTKDGRSSMTQAQERRRGSRPLAGVSPLLDKAATTSRRAKLWLLLRRLSKARAEPLIPSVDSSISSLSVPLVPVGDESRGKDDEDKRVGVRPEASGGVGMMSAPTEESVATNETIAMKNVASDSGSVAGEVSAPQAVGGGGWNLFGFFPKDKGETGKGNSATGGKKDAAAADSAPVKTSETAEFVGDGRERAGRELLWPLSALMDGYDPRAQVEAAMALTSAFGYGAIGSASALAPEVFAAAAEAAGNAAVAEATTAANGQDGKSLSPTTQYLEDLSPSGGTEEEREEAGRWRGAEIA
ncbi:unnamed protein product, partial [Sphacelaria rigidula]